MRKHKAALYSGGKKPRPRHKYAGIYKITVCAEGALHLYIGQSKNVFQRYHQHQSSLRACKHANPRLQALFNEYGPQAFEMTIVELVPNVRLLEARERAWIEATNPDLNIMDTKLCPEDVETIKNMKARGIHSEDICAKFHLTPKYLREILRGGRWKSAEGAGS